ncbi:hypothetical protein HJC99_03650, partial [Candidatus Saccharibacteria bacterium]|nr:hypothetical protein [Candidatus Saccharibacteria bacterium]
NSSHTSTLTISIDATNYNNGTPHSPTLAKLSGAASCAILSQPIIDYPNVDPITGASTAVPTSPTCDQGSLTWLACPVIENISTHISAIAIDILTPLLRINTITPTSTPQLYQVWAHVRDFADLLFIGVFFAIIISTIFEQDIGGLNPYTIKTTWVRLIIAAVLVQFSFILSGVIVDLGNVAGAGVAQIFTAISGGSAAVPDTSHVIGNLVTGSVAAVTTVGVAILATWEIALPILLGLLITVFVAFLTLGARFLIISILIVIAPLACVAWVLPNTRHYMSDWFKLLTRLVMMYPIIVGVFTLAGIASEILPFTTSTADSGVAKAAILIVQPLITLAAFLLIPESFRLAGKGLNRAYSIMNGAGGKSKGWLKNSQLYKDGKTRSKERKASFMQNLATNDTITSLSKSDAGIKRVAGKGLLTASGLVLMAPRNPKSIEQAYNKAQGERVKELKGLESVSPPLLGSAVLAAYGSQKDMEKIKREAPALHEYTQTLAGRAALVTQANAMGIFGDEHERMILGSNRRNEFGTLQTALGKNNFKEKPHLQRVDSKGLARADFATAVKDYSAGFMNNTLDKGAIEAAIGKKTVDVNGNVMYTVDPRSQSMVSAWASQLSPGQITAYFDPSNRNYGTREKRAMVLQMVANNLSTFQTDKNGRDILTELKLGLAHEKNKDIYMDFYNVRGIKSWAQPLDPQSVAADRTAMLNDIISHL